MLTLVPFSMATVDRLEADGQFPKRVRLDPTNRVAWLRREVTAHLRQLAKRQQSVVQKDHVKGTNQKCGFDPIPGQLFCKCGVELSRFSLSRHSDNSAFISCRACHAELAQINFKLEKRS